MLTGTQTTTNRFTIKDIVRSLIVVTVINLFFMMISCRSCFTDLGRFIEFYTYGCLIGFSIYYPAAFFNTWLSKKVDWLNRPWHALGLVTIGNVVLTFFVLLVINCILFGLMKGQSFTSALSNFELASFLITLLITLFITSLFQGAAFLKVWKESMINSERLKQATLNAQFETLNSQVNPHFLFNSLNVLSALIHKDADKAEHFIQELSNVYRNLLDTRKEEVISLKRDIESLQSYMTLLKMRFGERLVIEMDLEPSEDEYVVPFALQMLAENAIKHNVASSENPLVIRFYKTDSNIVVENNILLKEHGVESRGIGLKNISERYFLLNKSEIVVEDSGSMYKVSLPLIED